jgi:hypothetical protein
MIFENGVIQQGTITKANVHDINFLKQIDNLPAKMEILGDRAYISKTVQADLFYNHDVKLTVPFRQNQHDYKKYPRKNKLKRQMVETVFAQLWDHLNFKRNYAKSYAEISARLNSKLSGVSLLQFINYKTGNKISKIKQAFSFKWHNTLNANDFINSIIEKEKRTHNIGISN